MTSIPLSTQCIALSGQRSKSWCPSMLCFCSANALIAARRTRFSLRRTKGLFFQVRRYSVRDKKGLRARGPVLLCRWRALIFDEAAECCVSHRMRDLLLIAPQRRDRNLCKKLALILLAGAVLGQMAANCRLPIYGNSRPNLSTHAARPRKF